MGNILRYHFAMARNDFPKHRSKGREGLSIPEVTPTLNGVIERVSLIPWGWGNKELYSPEKLEQRLQSPQMRLFNLCENGEVIGYALTSPATHVKAFNAIASNQSIIELENLALFPNNEGNGKGWAFFTLVMDELYKEYDAVYWSQSETNHPHLKDYYIRKGMNYLGADSVPDFTSKPAVA